MWIHDLKVTPSTSQLKLPWNPRRSKQSVGLRGARVVTTRTGDAEAVSPAVTRAHSVALKTGLTVDSVEPDREDPLPPWSRQMYDAAVLSLYL